MLWLTPAMDRLWLEGAAERRRFLDRVTLSLVPEHGEAAIAYDRALRERNRLIRDEVRDPAWFDALEARMAAEGARLGREPRRSRWSASRRRRGRGLSRARASPSRPRGRATRPALREALRDGAGRGTSPPGGR